jgi:chloramphenicol-sensitive protein RarD
MTDFLLFGGGVVTSLPLLWFINAGKRLRYSTIGFIQYLTPSIQLLIGVYLYHEPFTPTHSITFGLIWAGLVIFSINSLFVQSPS